MPKKLFKATCENATSDKEDEFKNGGLFQRFGKKHSPETCVKLAEMDFCRLWS